MTGEEKTVKESGGRKNLWRYLFGICAIYGAWKLLGVLWVNLIYLGVRGWDHFSPQSMAVSIGIIGGADGPTAVFVAAPPWAQNLVSMILLVVGIWGYFRLSRRRRE